MTKASDLASVALVLIVLFIPVGSSLNGPKTDVLRFVIIKSPDAKTIALQTGVADVWSSMSVPADVYSSILAEAYEAPRPPERVKLKGDGFLYEPANVGDLTLNVGYIGFNIRDTATIQSYYRPEITYWPLHDVEFRHALLHCYDQRGIIASIYGNTAIPVRSLAPPAQAKYYNPGVQEHPYDPGSPFQSAPYDMTSCGILLAAGYTFNDAGTIGMVDDADYWKCPGGADMPYLEIWTPLVGVAPTSWQHGQEFVIDLSEIGLAATTANGNKGILSLGRDFNDYLADVYDRAEFDAYMICNYFDRLPEQIYLLFHSNQNSLTYPGRRNAPGVDDPAIDTLAETVKFSLDTDDMAVAAKEIQEMMYTPEKSVYPNSDNFALAYMVMHSKLDYFLFHPDLRGIVISPAYGLDNKWTFLNINWSPEYNRTEDGKTVVIWMLGDEPDRSNPLYAGTKYEWEILARVYDGLTNINPYSHHEIPWLATDWVITEIMGGMAINFTLRDDVYWQDGYQFTANDVEFCLEFIRDYHVPKYANPCEHLVDVIVTNATHFTVIADESSLALFYEFAGLAALLPPQIWDRTWASDQAVLNYEPREHAYGTDMAPGYSAGPTPPPTNLFGTGPWIFQVYDDVLWYADLWKNENYFMPTVEVVTLLMNMFWEVGDFFKDGTVEIVDLTYTAFSYGSIQGLDPNYDTRADYNSDSIVDMRDLYICGYHALWQKRHPYP